MFERTVANAHIIDDIARQNNPDYIRIGWIYPVNSKGVVDLSRQGAIKGKPIIDVHVDLKEFGALFDVIARTEEGETLYFPLVHGHLNDSYRALGLHETQPIHFKYKKLTTNRPIVFSQSI
jgi:hypothetical protein